MEIFFMGRWEHFTHSRRIHPFTLLPVSGFGKRRVDDHFIQIGSLTEIASSWKVIQEGSQYFSSLLYLFLLALENPILRLRRGERESVDKTNTG
jgi:hypothetical protein